MDWWCLHNFLYIWLCASKRQPAAFYYKIFWTSSYRIITSPLFFFLVLTLCLLHSTLPHVECVLCVYKDNSREMCVRVYGKRWGEWTRSAIGYFIGHIKNEFIFKLYKDMQRQRPNAKQHRSTLRKCWDANIPNIWINLCSFWCCL